jgi:hypothetical protein
MRKPVSHAGSVMDSIIITFERLVIPELLLAYMVGTKHKSLRLAEIILSY